MAATRFFTFRQNNSGGGFEHNEADGIGITVCVEAHDAAEANDRATAIGIYFDGCVNGLDCPCCGDRWSPVDDSDATDSPELYGAPISAENGADWGVPAYIHHLGEPGVVRIDPEAKE